MFPRLRGKIVLVPVMAAFLASGPAFAHAKYDSVRAEPPELEIAYFMDAELPVPLTLLDQLKLAEKGLAEMDAPAAGWPRDRDSRNGEPPAP